MTARAPWLVRKSQLQNAGKRKAAGQHDQPPSDDLTDPVDISSDDSFPASDPPSFTPMSGAGRRRGDPRRDSST
jgi:hypothetical protein